MKITCLLASLVITISCFAQSPESLYKKGDSLYKLKDYKNAAMAYAAGIKLEGKDADVVSYWRAASRFALAGMPDSSFRFLDQLTTSRVISQPDVNSVESDMDFKSLYADPRWKTGLTKMRTQATANYAVEELIYDRKDGVALTMLQLKPRTASNHKAIIWIMAGSWFSSYSQAERSIRPSSVYLDKGFTVFLVILGSQPRYAIPDEISDAKRAVRYIRYNAQKLGINPGQIGITGGSAGGHLSLCVATAADKIDSTATDPVNRVSSRVQAAAVLYPPTDFLNWGNPGTSIINLATLTKANNVYGAFDFTTYNRTNNTIEHISDTAVRNKIGKEVSPLYAVTPDDPPVFIIHGDADVVVPLQQSQIFIEKLKAAGVNNSFVIKKGGTHNPATMLPEYLQFPDWFNEKLR